MDTKTYGLLVFFLIEHFVAMCYVAAKLGKLLNQNRHHGKTKLRLK